MKPKAKPMRRCIGCMESKEKQQLIRITLCDGTVSADPTGKANGRGAYLCPDRSCLDKARKRKAIQRSLGAELSAEEAEALFARIEALKEARETHEE